MEQDDRFFRFGEGVDQATRDYAQGVRSRGAGVVLPAVIFALGLAVALFALPFAKPTGDELQPQQVAAPRQ